MEKYFFCIILLTNKQTKLKPEVLLQVRAKPNLEIQLDMFKYFILMSQSLTRREGFNLKLKLVEILVLTIKVKQNQEWHIDFMHYLNYCKREIQECCSLSWKTLQRHEDCFLLHFTVGSFTQSKIFHRHGDSQQGVKSAWITRFHQRVLHIWATSASVKWAVLYFLKSKGNEIHFRWKRNSTVCEAEHWMSFKAEYKEIQQIVM